SRFDTIIFNVDVTTATIYDTDITLTFPAGFDGNYVINTINDTGDSTLNFLTAFGTVGMNMGVKIIDLGSGTQSGAITYDGTTSYQTKMAALRHDWSNRILWNFPGSNAATITSKGFDFIGSVLAPYSDFAGSGYGTGAMGLGAVNGTLVCKSLTQSNGWEAHNTTHCDVSTLPVFENTFTSPGGHILPVAGGSGALPYEITGGALTALLLMAFAATLIYRRNKRRGLPL
ncbi:MAG: choice-of-anchor A family protein, partial [Coriobacteriia bacterium]|nr:choice-of-anchor A family protein [Coriobacteriia bacterium]